MKTLTGSDEIYHLSKTGGCWVGQCSLMWTKLTTKHFYRTGHLAHECKKFKSRHGRENSATHLHSMSQNVVSMEIQ